MCSSLRVSWMPPSPPDPPSRRRDVSLAVGSQLSLNHNYCCGFLIGAVKDAEPKRKSRCAVLRRMWNFSVLDWKRVRDTHAYLVYLNIWIKSGETLFVAVAASEVHKNGMLL